MNIAPSTPLEKPRKKRSALGEMVTGSRLVAAMALAAALVILAGMAGAGAIHLRSHLREHLVQRDGEILYTVALARQYANGAGEALSKRMANPADQLALALDISQLREDTLAVRLFDAEGQFVTAFPPSVVETNLSPGFLPTLRRLQPVSLFREHANLSDYFWLAPGQTTNAESLNLLEVNIPLHARGDKLLLGTAQLLLDGGMLAREYARVDVHLWWLALVFYVIGATLLSLVLIWAYRRLRKVHVLLEERTNRLLRANHELALAAKTTALGAVTAHLIHGLSNPLANLQDFIASHGERPQEDDWRDAAAAAHRMQQLVHEVVRVLGEARGGDRYELTLAELVEVLNSKMHSLVHATGVNVVTEVCAIGTVSNHHANLILLILENLLHNALKVTPRGRWVGLRFAAKNGHVNCEVSDKGAGIPVEVLPRLFTPCRSTQGGSGLGLAISQQLAHQLGGTIELVANTAQGCVFSLRLPRTVVVDSSSSAQKLETPRTPVASI
jgi:signal transduction histidine kinase